MRRLALRDEVYRDFVVARYGAGFTIHHLYVHVPRHTRFLADQQNDATRGLWRECPGRLGVAAEGCDGSGRRYGKKHSRGAAEEGERELVRSGRHIFDYRTKQ